MHDLLRDEFPVTITMFEHLLMSLLHHVHIQVPTKHHVLIHSFGSDFADLGLLELEEGVALWPGSSFGASNAQFCDFAKLGEEFLEFLFVKTFGEVSNVNDSLFFAVTDLQFVETFGELALFAI